MLFAIKTNLRYVEGIPSSATGFQQQIMLYLSVADHITLPHHHHHIILFITCSSENLFDATEVYLTNHQNLRLTIDFVPSY